MGRPLTPQLGNIEEIRLLLAFQIAGRLSSDQRDGQACAWCDTPLAEGAGTSLGGDRQWRPHACRDCFDPRSEWLQAYFAWVDHFNGCRSRCGRGLQCDAREDFAGRVTAAGQRSGRTWPRCVRCQQALQLDDVFRPEPWDGNTGPVYSFVHILTADCVP